MQGLQGSLFQYSLWGPNSKLTTSLVEKVPWNFCLSDLCVLNPWYFSQKSTVVLTLVRASVDICAPVSYESCIQLISFFNWGCNNLACDLLLVDLRRVLNLRLPPQSFICCLIRIVTSM